jgi:hypothetical protein
MNGNREKDQTARLFLIWLLGIGVAVLALFLAWQLRLPSRIEVSGRVSKLPQAAVEQQQEKNQQWVIDVEIPVEHVEHVRAAQVGNNELGDLDVDLLLMSMPTKRYLGKLARDKIGPVIRLGVAQAQVRIQPVDGDIPDEVRVPDGQLIDKMEVRARIRYR